MVQLSPGCDEFAPSGSVEEGPGRLWRATLSCRPAPGLGTLAAST